MKFEKIDCGGGIAAIVSSDSQVIVDVDSALDLLMSAKYEAGTKYIAVDKKLITEDFFVLSSGLAGEVLQKYINYGGKIAIYGDFSRYTSKPLKDFIYESNKGKDVFFVATKDTSGIAFLRASISVSAVISVRSADRNCPLSIISQPSCWCACRGYI